MAKGRFNIKGTKDFLVMAVFCGFLCVWAVRDAWFPTQKVLEKHPLEVAVAFQVPGVIRQIHVEPGEKVEGKMVLATLHESARQEAVERARAAYEKAREQKSSDMEQKLSDLMDAREALAACTLENTDLSVTTSHGKSTLHGKVLRIEARPSMSVDVLRSDTAGDVLRVSKDTVFVGAEKSALKDAAAYPLDGLAPVVSKGDSVAAGDALAGTPVLVINPEDTFYMFNQTLAVLSFIGMIAALIFHWIASH
jgi:biotin carboxyl carrier protein